MNKLIYTRNKILIYIYTCNTKNFTFQNYVVWSSNRKKLIFESFSKYTFMILTHVENCFNATYVFCSSHNVISFPKISQMSSKKKNHKFRSNVNLILILASSLLFYFIYMLYTKINTKEICNNKLQDNIISVNVLHHKTIKKILFHFPWKNRTTYSP